MLEETFYQNFKTQVKFVFAKIEIKESQVENSA